MWHSERNKCSSVLSTEPWDEGGWTKEMSVTGMTWPSF